jgi:5-hydroxyisourate hydrolase-like protein (transthyretin family)
MKFRMIAAGMLLLASLVPGCSRRSEGSPRVKTYPCFGVVEVDGEPAAGVMVVCYPDKDGAEQKLPSGSMTGENGKFVFSTYAAGDGVPAGNYTLVFKWKELGIGETADRLGSAYSDPTKSNFHIAVGPGESGDQGVIELSTKPVAK